mgnify:CR=1 FL=1
MMILPLAFVAGFAPAFERVGLRSASVTHIFGRGGAVQLEMPSPTTATPLEALWLLRGSVKNGYGRGSKKIGVPTANLPASELAANGAIDVIGVDGAIVTRGQLEELPRGVYVAWAGLRGQAYPAVVNVGLSPTFETAQNPEPIAEAHLLEDVADDFYGEVCSASPHSQHAHQPCDDAHGPRRCSC